MLPSTRPRGERPSIGDIELQTLDRVTIRVDELGGTLVGVATKEPIAVVIRTATGTWRVDLETLLPHDYS